MISAPRKRDGFFYPGILLGLAFLGFGAHPLAQTIPSTEQKKLNDDLIVASRLTRLQDVERALAANADVNATSGPAGLTPLIEPSRSRSGLEIVKTLLQHGADPNKKSNSGTTPLMRARTADCTLADFRRRQRPSRGGTRGDSANAGC
jgi:Ankyrin repeats (many copies)